MSAVHSLPSGSGKWKDLWSVQSHSRPDASYIVGRTANGEYGCSCPQWKFHSPRKDCKHIRQVMKVLASKVKVEVAGNDILSKPAVQKAISRFSLIEI